MVCIIYVSSRETNNLFENIFALAFPLDRADRHLDDAGTASARYFPTALWTRG